MEQSIEFFSDLFEPVSAAYLSKIVDEFVRLGSIGLLTNCVTSKEEKNRNGTTV